MNIKLTKSELKSLDAQVITTSSSFGGMVTAMAAVTTAGLAFRSIVQTGKDFEFQMAKVGAVSGASERELRKLTDQARNLGGTTANTAAEIGGLQENLARLRSQGSAPAVKMKASDEDIKLGAPATYEVPVTFDTANFFV